MPENNVEKGGNVSAVSKEKNSNQQFPYALEEEAEKLDLDNLARTITSEERVLGRLDDLEEDPTYFDTKKVQIKNLRGRMI
jgi:hypothetical protein